MCARAHVTRLEELAYKAYLTATEVFGKVGEEGKEQLEYAASLRLLRTESSHIAQEGARKAYEEIGLEKYKILSTLDSVTCKRCGALDGVSIEVKERKPGVNSPPFHPNCRCTTVPDVDDLDLELDDEGNPIEEERVYRDENGKSVIGPEMSYDEWKKKYVGGDKTAKVDELLKAKAEAEKNAKDDKNDKVPKNDGKNKAPDGKKPKVPKMPGGLSFSADNTGSFKRFADSAKEYFLKKSKLDKKDSRFKGFWSRVSSKIYELYEKGKINYNYFAEFLSNVPEAVSRYADKSSALNALDKLGFRVSEPKDMPIDAEVIGRIATWFEDFFGKFSDKFRESFVADFGDFIFSENAQDDDFGKVVFGFKEINSNEIADCGLRFIMLNARCHYNVGFLEMAMKLTGAAGDHPANSNTVQPTAHEAFHVTAYLLALKKYGMRMINGKNFLETYCEDIIDKVHAEYLRRHPDETIDVIKMVSENAAKNAMEEFAELGSEAFGNTGARELAEIFGEVIKTEINEAF